MNTFGSRLGIFIGVGCFPFPFLFTSFSRGIITDTATFFMQNQAHMDNRMNTLCSNTVLRWRSRLDSSPRMRKVVCSNVFITKVYKSSYFPNHHE